jgi:hypothetical protein
MKAGISVSVIGLGTERDCDADLLNDVAKRGGGQALFTNVAQELPRLFAQDTFMIARSAFIEEPVEVRSTGGLTAINRQPWGDFPQIGGYNLCYVRPDANLAMVSVDEYQGPVVTSWQAGLGRVLCYTGEADGKYTGPIAGWKSVGDFFTSLARWTAGKNQELGKEMVATQELRGGVCRVELHLDPARETTPLDRLPELTTLSARPGEIAVPRKSRMNWSSADTLLAEIPLAGSETILTTISAAGMGQVTLAPMCLPYSPEYQPPKPGQGVDALERLAKSTGGCERLNLAGIWRDIPRRPRLIVLAPYLLLAAVVIFLLEVVQRRTGLLSLRRRLPVVSRQESVARVSEKAATAVGRKAKRVVAAAADKPQLAAAPPADGSGGKEGMSDALSQAQRRARKRTERS